MLFVSQGLPRCGKSKFADIWLKHETRRVVVAGDDIRLALTGERFNHCAEEMVLTIKHLMIKSLLIRGHTVLHDGTNTDISSVNKLLKIGETLNQRMIFVLFDTPKEECIRRAYATNQPDLEPVINRMADNMVQSRRYILDKFENPNSICSIKTSKINDFRFHAFQSDTSTYDTIMLYDDANLRIKKFDTNVIRITNDNSIHSV